MAYLTGGCLMKKIKNNSKTMKGLVIFGIIILPLIYSFFYLKGFWDPYNSLTDVPVALVNLDECTENCQGDKLIDKLTEEGTFDFEVVSEEEADSGLINKDYYAVIKIPKDFTSNLESGAGEERQQATITYMPNTKTNYLASQIIGTAVDKVEVSLQAEVNKEIVANLTSTLQSVPEQTKQIGNSLGALSSGSNSLNNGTLELQNGLNNLSNSYKLFNNGVEKLSLGISSLYNAYGEFNTGLDEAYNGAVTLSQQTTGLSSLQESVNTLKDGSNTYTEGLKTYQSNAMAMIDNTTLVYTKIINYVENHPELQSDSEMMTIYGIAKGYMTAGNNGETGLSTLKSGLNNLVSSNDSINNGLNLLANETGKLGDLQTGISELENGLFNLRENSNTVYGSLDELNNGLLELKDSSVQIDNGIGSADAGVSTLASGTNSLNKAVNLATTEMNNKIDDTEKQTASLAGLDEYAKDPVKVTEEDYGEVKEYGTFFSPYFMSLSLWIGGVLILMGLYYDPDKRFKVLGRNSEKRGLRLVFYNVIGVIQAILLAFILKLTLGFEVTNYLLYYVSCILISEAFLAIIMFLFFTFKDIGKFLALVLLVLQLASCGGTFPVETEPAFYQAIYAFMPMTYSVDLLRESFVSINSAFLVKDVVILLSIFVIFNVLIWLVGMIKNKNERKVLIKNTSQKVR